MGHYIAFVHGIGEQQPGSYRDFGERLRVAFEGEVQRTGRPRSGRQSADASKTLMLAFGKVLVFL